MKNKTKAGFGSTLIKIVLAVPHLISYAYHLMSLIACETKLAGKSIITIIALSVIFASMLTTTWICLLGILFLYFTSLQWSPMASMLIILLLNILVMIIIGLMISMAKKNLLFPATREQIRELIRKND